MAKKWIELSREFQGQTQVFRHYTVKRKSPDTQKQGQFDVISCYNWINVVAITKNNELVIVEQYRHGTDEVTWEIPGGAVDPAEIYLEAAKREFREETGMVAEHWTKIGFVKANPAFMSNHCTTFLATGVTIEGKQKLDPLEEIDVRLLPVDQIDGKISDGTIDHSLVIAALFFLAAVFWKK